MKKTKQKKLAVKKPQNLQEQFNEIEFMVRQARRRAYSAINVELVELYWNVGKYISQKVASAEWGTGVVYILT